MTEPLDVSLRVRMRYEAAGTAARVIGDLDQVRAKTAQLGAIPAGDRLGRDLAALGTAAGRTTRDLAGVAGAAARLGAGAGDGAARMAAGLKGVEQAGGGAARELAGLGQAAARFGAAGTVSSLARDLRAAAAPAEAARRGLAAVEAAADRLGQGRGVRVLEQDLDAAGRRADDLGRRMEGLHRRMEGGRRPLAQSAAHRAERFAFGNEALMASGLGAGLHFGMGGAAAGGLAAGAGIAATGGAIAAATRQAISFESAMAEVRKATSDLSPEAFAAMERTILRTSRTTGIAKEEMAKLVAQAGFAGRPTEELARFAEFGAKAAGAFGMTAEATGDALAKMGNVFKLPQAGIEDLADGINVLGDNTASRERQIVDFLYRAGNNGKALKFTALQTAAIGAAAISSGKEAEVAATGFNAFTMKLGTAHRQGEDFQKGLRAIGLTGRRVKADIDANPVEGFLNVLERLNRLPENKKLDVASRLGGMEYGDDLLAYAGLVDQIRKSLAQLQDQSARAGSVEKTFKIFDATTERSIARAGTNIEAFATKLGQRFTPAVRESAGAVERWFGGLTKALELSDRAAALAAKIAKGVRLSEGETGELAADPRLKAETDRRVERGREDAERRAILEADGRAAAAPKPEASKPEASKPEAGKPEAGRPAAAPRPREPDEQDAAAAQARERTRRRLQSEMQGLEGEIAGRRAGGYETTADRLRLRRLRQQYQRQFPPAPEVPAAPPAPATEPKGDGQARREQPALPGADRRSDLQDGARVSLAAYHDTVEASLARTERVVHAAGRRMREDLAITAKVDLAAFRFGRGDGARIEAAALGGSARWGATEAGPGSRPGRFDPNTSGAPALGFGGGPGVAAGRSGGGPRIAPGRFGGAVPDARPPHGEAVPSTGDPRRFGSTSAVGRGASTGEGRENVASWQAFFQRPKEQGGMGLPHDKADAMVAMMQGESGPNLNPRSYNPDDNGGPSGGTAQWHDGRDSKRFTALQSFAQGRGTDWRDRETQQQFWKHEAETTHRRAFGRIEGAGSAEEALHEGVKGFEVPADIPGETRKRMANLNRLRRDRDGPTEGTGPAGAATPGENGEFDPLGGAARRYTSGFGMREHPVHGGRRMHYGQDMAAPAGTAVNAMQPGRISGIDRQGDVTVTHPDGSTKTYRHIDPGGVRVGQDVEAGGPIGRLRAHDARSTGPHLHLEATDPQGRRYDPRAEIEAARRHPQASAVAVDVPEHWRSGGPARALRIPGEAELRPRRLPEPDNPTDRVSTAPDYGPY